MKLWWGSYVERNIRNPNWEPERSFLKNMFWNFIYYKDLKEAGRLKITTTFFVQYFFFLFFIYSSRHHHHHQHYRLLPYFFLVSFIKTKNNKRNINVLHVLFFSFLWFFHLVFIISFAFFSLSLSLSNICDII